MTDFDYLRIAKWIVIVLLAGFIGQFGKSLAKHLMERIRRNRKGSSPKNEGTPIIPGRGLIEGAPGLQEPHPATMSPEKHAKQDKKLAKTMIKQKKKVAKALKKQADP
jgi:hypothetical protein